MLNLRSFDFVNAEYFYHMYIEVGDDSIIQNFGLDDIENNNFDSIYTQFLIDYKFTVIEE